MHVLPAFGALGLDLIPQGTHHCPASGCIFTDGKRSLMILQTSSVAFFSQSALRTQACTRVFQYPADLAKPGSSPYLSDLGLDLIPQGTHHCLTIWLHLHRWEVLLDEFEDLLSGLLSTSTEDASLHTSFSISSELGEARRLSLPFGHWVLILSHRALATVSQSSCIFTDGKCSFRVYRLPQRPPSQPALEDASLHTSFLMSLDLARPRGSTASWGIGP